MGTQTGWQPDWGWGAIDLAAALDQRTNFGTGDVPGGSARFYRASGVAAADRATLVWYRRASSACFTGRCEPHAMTLTNLDLQQLDPATGAVQSESASSIDNVEQVRSPGAAGDVVYKVRATSAVDGLGAEPYALAARRPLTPLATPRPQVSLDVEDGVRRPGDTATVTATVRNPSRRPDRGERGADARPPRRGHAHERRGHPHARHPARALGSADLHVDGPRRRGRRRARSPRAQPPPATARPSPRRPATS